MKDRSWIILRRWLHLRHGFAGGLLVQDDVRLEVGSGFGALSFRTEHARNFVQFRLCRCVIIVLPLKRLRELQVENWVLFAL